TCSGCEAQPDVFLRVYSYSEDARVQSAYDGQPFVWVSPTTVNAPPDLDLGGLSIVSRATPAFGVLTTLMKAWRWSKSLGHLMPPVNCDVGGSVHTFYQPTSATIELENSEKWNQSTIVHEYGHHWMWKLAPISASYTYANGVCDNPSPGHCFGCAEMDVAGWIEGFADWFSAEYGKNWELQTGVPFIRELGVPVD